MGEIDVLHELEIVHPDADEVGAALKAAKSTSGEWHRRRAS